MPGHSTRLWVHDWNGDGKLDLIVGDSVTIIRPREGIAQEFFTAKETEIRSRQEKLSELLNQLNSMPDSNLSTPHSKLRLQAEHNRLYLELQQLIAARFQWAVEQKTGFVWVYLRR